VVIFIRFDFSKDEEFKSGEQGKLNNKPAGRLHTLAIANFIGDSVESAMNQNTPKR